MKKTCDGFHNCISHYDEQSCDPLGYVFYEINPPAVINFDRPGGFTVTPFQNNSIKCPDTHFQCHDDGYCLPVYVRCNDMIDCPGHEDEADCENYETCPGFFRCRDVRKTICVHVNHLCDGLPQCPLHDDELVCYMACPASCVCYGFAFSCNTTFLTSSFPQLRYLEASGSGMHIKDVIHNIMLIHLGVEACGLMNLTEVVLPNIHSMDLSNNLILSINFSHFVGMPQLRRLNLAGNPLTGVTCAHNRYTRSSLVVFNMSHVQAHSLNMSALSVCMPNLHILDLSWNKIKVLWGQDMFHNVRIFDLQGCPIVDFTPNFMKQMTNLMYISADTFKLCCSVVLPDNFRGHCMAPSDEISSCDNLLKSTAYRCVLVVFAVLAILGNFGGFVYRIFYLSESTKTGFAIVVLHLCTSDCLMGMYLAFIGIADQIYAGTYIWNETNWKKSSACNVAGFLSLLSSEVSALLICLITLDRFLVLHFPFGLIRFGVRSAHMTCAIIWGLGFTLAMVPLLPATSHWEFYHQTGICIPLPVTRAEFPGHVYSFSIMIVFNLVLFLMIGMGQVLIYWSVRGNTMSKQLTKSTEGITETAKSKEAAAARHLLLVAVSDFLCWFPIGLSGVLAANGVAIPGEVNVGMAIFVLPFNSALNPFLYTLNIVLEKRRKAKELRFQKLLRAQLKS